MEAVSGEETRLVFIDCETTGLDPLKHEIFEIAIIVRDGMARFEREYWLPVDLRSAEPDALRLNQYYHRLAQKQVDKEWKHDEPEEVAAELAEISAAAHIVGINPSFDARFLEILLRKNGYRHAWHYHLVDVLPLVAGKLGIGPPWSSEELSRALEIEPPPPEVRHSALGDIQWTEQLYEAVISGEEA